MITRTSFNKRLLDNIDNAMREAAGVPVLRPQAAEHHRAGAALPARVARAAVVSPQEPASTLATKQNGMASVSDDIRK